MIIVLILGAMADFILFALGLLLSFAIGAPWRPWIRVATVLLALPLIPVAYFIRFPDALIPIAWHEPRNVAELQRDFPSKKADLETILRMSGEDRDFTRIAPGSVDRAIGASTASTTYNKPDPRIALPRSRWDQYRQIFARNGVRDGIERSPNGDAFIDIGTIGLFDRSRTVGYAYCVPDLPAATSRVYPCDHSGESGSRTTDPAANGESAFQRLDGAWYAFQE